MGQKEQFQVLSLALKGRFGVRRSVRVLPSSPVTVSTHTLILPKGLCYRV